MMYKGKELDEYISNGREFIKVENLSGKNFGNWIVICRSPNKRGSHHFWCECSCGETQLVSKHNLLIGKSVRCKKCSNKKSGKTRFKLYNSFPIGLWNRFIRGAKDRNIEFNITIEYAWSVYLKQNRKCAISGLELEFCTSQSINKTTGRKTYFRHTISLDRIDSNKGYIEGNIQWLHKDINKMKLDHDQEYFISLCKKIVENNK